MNLLLENTEYTNWQNRHPDILSKLIMSGAEQKLNDILKKYNLSFTVS